MRFLLSLPFVRELCQLPVAVAYRIGQLADLAVLALSRCLIRFP